ncbi:AAA family ATPase [Campylobacter jejuni]|uniref:AAA family ATPase n=1 Tax=Campylobacter jejuni TaxID=197 RepID=UPI000874F50E|nr:AAA family ATPase [Campylobacter jejuni]EAI7225946.1 AAA family ATPase [Campylobacter jejuni]EAJ7087653.1 AAA family ATPase [Campylobacter jejuni]EAJ7659688.1 AAA family ATPase [Campylobacter jejuni]EAK1072550.1 AAA family ATPase [Campylobacter jejuni]EAK4038813.1 AAA family ATPase [Campylobacter jejuni]
MIVNIKNCNSIIDAKIKIIENKLNIKYGINGTGKTTISKAISYSLEEDKQKLITLMPFTNDNNNLTPEVKIEDGIVKKVLVFNESYIEQFVYREDELLQNSYEILIKDEVCKNTEIEIEILLSSIKQSFENDERLQKVIDDFEELNKKFKPSKNGLSKSSIGYKAVKNGNKIDNIPQELQCYSSFLTSDKNIEWIDWQIKGKGFIENNDICPFCANEIKENKKTIELVSENYSAKEVDNLKKILETIENLKYYFHNESLKRLNEILRKSEDLSVGDENFLSKISCDIGMFLENLNNIKKIYSLIENSNEPIKKQLSKLKIDIQNYDNLNSDKTNEIIKHLNDQLEELENKSSELEGKINKHKQHINKNIKKHQNSINDFLQKAGYKYQVFIEDNKLKLKYIGVEKNINNADQYLSYGEKNAFALVLFMCQAVSEKCDLVILDDPISSFDKNKKYAIIDMLFSPKNKNNNLFNKTVLMLTHDLDPIIDILKVKCRNFHEFVNANFLKNNDGKLFEFEIKKENLKSFVSICDEVIRSNKNILIKLAYLRRYYELINNSGCYNIISELLHGRSIGEFKNKTITKEDTDNAIEEITNKIQEFKYENILQSIQDKDYLVKLYNEEENSYFKVALFRILHEHHNSLFNSRNEVFIKFINEVYHLENETLYQLSHCNYELIPSYIVNECDLFVEELQEKES